MLILADFKSDKKHGLLIIIKAHLPVVLIIFLVLKERDPLLVSIEPSVENDELWDRDTSNVLFHASSCADEIDVLVGNLSRQRNGHGWRKRSDGCGVQRARTEPELDRHVLLRQVIQFLFEHDVVHRYLHVVSC